MSQPSANQIKRPAAARMIARSVLVLAATAVISGCSMTQRHHITVGAVPDDYRTNHPITITESEQAFDLAVASNASAPSNDQLKSVDGLLAAYRDNGSGPIILMLPLGSSNEHAAGLVGGKLARYISQAKTGGAGVNTVYYQAVSRDAPAPVRIVYSALSASTDRCGRWPEDLTSNTENKHYENFGCSYQNNLAAQIANPNDLRAPRAPGEIDAANRQRVIGNYQNGDREFTSTVNF